MALLDVGAVEDGALELGELEVGALEEGALELGALEVGDSDGLPDGLPVGWPVGEGLWFPLACFSGRSWGGETSWFAVPRGSSTAATTAPTRMMLAPVAVVPRVK